MKKLKFLMLILIGAVLFQSCNDDDESNSEADLVGLWTVNEVDIELLANDTDLVEYLVSKGASTEEAELLKSFYELFATAAFANTTIEFKSDNTYEANQSGDLAGSGSWSVNSNATQITLDAGTEDEATYQIVSLSGSQMVLLVSESEMDDIDEDGTDEEVTFNFTLNLSK